MSEWPASVDPNKIYEWAKQQARSVYKEFRQFVEFEDIVQEMVLHAWSKREYIEGYLDRDEAEDRKSGENAVKRLLWQAGQQYARHEKSAKLGYKTDDEFFYSREQIRELLRVWYYQEFTGQEVPDERPRGKSMKPLNERQDIVAMVADIGVALKELPKVDLDFLFELYVFGKTSAELGHMLGLTQQQVDQRSHRTLKRLQRALGGPSPYAT